MGHVKIYVLSSIFNIHMLEYRILESQQFDIMIIKFSLIPSPFLILHQLSILLVINIISCIFSFHWYKIIFTNDWFTLFTLHCCTIANNLSVSWIDRSTLLWINRCFPNTKSSWLRPFAHVNQYLRLAASLSSYVERITIMHSDDDLVSLALNKLEKWIEITGIGILI